MRELDPPTTQPTWQDGTLPENLERAGVPRREFLAFCSRMAAIIAAGTPVVAGALNAPSAQAVERAIVETMSSIKKPTVVWLQLQECTGCVESALRSGGTTVEDLVLNLLSVDYLEAIMAASGEAAEKALHDANQKDHILVVNGSIPLGADGAYAVIGGRSARTMLEEAAENASAIIAVGACAVWGSVQASRPNPTGAVGVDEIIKDKPVLNVAGCPPIGEVITAAITYVLTQGKLPETDGEGRPMFAYGKRIHDICPRRARYDAGQYVRSFDDAGAAEGWCLYEVGCKGPDTFSPCPTIMWNLGTSWPIGAGHPCIGCTEKHFFDRFTPFYQALPAVDVPGFGIERSANRVGATMFGVAAAAVAAHAGATAVTRAAQRRKVRAAEPLAAFGETERVWLPDPTRRPEGTPPAASASTPPGRPDAAGPSTTTASAEGEEH